MRFHNPEASILVPDGRPVPEAVRRITHLGIGAHQDDLEIMAFHGIEACFGRRDLWFGAVICTNGAGSPRTGEYASYSDEEMAALRRAEQEKAAVIGNYGLLVQLNHRSPAVKDVSTGRLKDDLVEVLRAARPELVYTHNPIDKHETHLAVVFTALAALRELPAEERPRAVYGCEVWRGLDWMDDTDKVAFDVGARKDLAMALVGVYESQVAGGKRYDLATMGRRRSNATYFQSHHADAAEEIWFAMDLTPVVRDDSLDVPDFVLSHVDKFRRSVEAQIGRFWVQAP